MGCLRAAALSQLREGIFIPPRSVDDKLDDILKVKHSERLLHHCVMSVLEICGFAVKRSEKKKKKHRRYFRRDAASSLWPWKHRLIMWCLAIRQTHRLYAGKPRKNMPKKHDYFTGIIQKDYYVMMENVHLGLSWWMKHRATHNGPSITSCWALTVSWLKVTTTLFLHL